MSRPHFVLYDKYWRPIWDSETATTPPYQHIADKTMYTIESDDGREYGIMYRCPEGIKRHNVKADQEFMKHLTEWPTVEYGR